MTYKEYRDKRQQDFNSLPIFFAFGKEQFREQMEKRGLTVDDTDKIYALGAGGYYLRSDADVVRSFFDAPKELPELMKDPDFAEDAFAYEMKNHEYWLNDQGDWDVCSCFGSCEYDYGKDATDYLREIGYGDSTIEAYKIARTEVCKEALEKDWY